MSKKPGNYNKKKYPIDKDVDLLNKRIKAVPKEPAATSMDLANTLISDMACSKSSQIDVGAIESFTNISRKRDELYNLLDSMAEDSMMASALEIYAEDVTEKNPHGDIIWAEASDPNISKFVNSLLKSLNVDKHMYEWAYSLCKYGDLYIKLYRKSEIEDKLFDGVEDDTPENVKDEVKRLNEGYLYNNLNEDVYIKALKKSDRYVHFIERVYNPAEMFDLIKFGKTYGYIEAPVYNTNYRMTDTFDQYNTFSRQLYQYRKQDIKVHSATSYVHACLQDGCERFPESIQIFFDNNYTNDPNDTSSSCTYTVKHGQSVLYDIFKIWRQLTLLENSVLLNRLTRSAIVRVIGVEVGDMPKEKVGPHMQNIKSLVEQKASINDGVSMTEYTNPAPVTNNIFVPTRNNVGTISVQDIGSENDVNVSNLADLDYFKTKLYAALKIPKQYMGDTNDGAGFDGGSSLAQISSRYAKTVKRVQQSLIFAMTDCINLMLIDRGLSNYINRFTLNMTEPSTVEKKEQQEVKQSNVSLVNDVMGLLSDIEDPIRKLEMLKVLLKDVLDGDELISLLQEEIDEMQKKVNSENAEAGQGEEAPEGGPLGDFGGDLGGNAGGDFGGGEETSSPMDDLNSLLDNGGGETAEAPAEGGGEEISLPSMQDAGIDFADNTAEI